MNRHDKLSGAIGVLIGLGFCIASSSLGLGEVHHPGPGFLPFLVGAALILLSAVILLPALRKKKGSNEEGTTRGMGKYRKGGLILLALIFYNAALGVLGLGATTFLFVVFLMKGVEAQRWPRTIVTALCSAVGFYLIFQSWLRLDFPTGPWRF
jgi:putative tricarboxylic transport membrane protein